MVDYRRFLQKAGGEQVVAPWLGGLAVETGERRLRLAQAPAREGWYRLEVKGRQATVVGPAEPPALSGLPAVRGWLHHGRLVVDGARAVPLHLLPDDEPPAFSPALARRWHDGELLFDALEFESEAEGALREALADERAIAQVKGVAAPLRAAYGFALLERVSRRLRVPAAAAEVRARVGEVAEGGAPKAEAVLRALKAEREQAARELAEHERRLQELRVRRDLELARQARVTDQERLRHDADERARDALEKAGAQVESTRRAGPGQLEVVFRFMGERFVALANELTLQVIDSGICLGHPPRDDLVTLESLPSVIREAIDTGALVILRHP